MNRCLHRGAAGSGRSDDNEESLKKRFNTYIGDTMPIIVYYSALGLVRKMDASKSPDAVFEDVIKAFE
jgi:UMP-CMP kinase